MVRAPRLRPGAGEYVTLNGDAMLPQQPDPVQQLVADLVRRYDPGGYRLQCPVAGCSWGLTIPRMELDPEHLAGEDWTVRTTGVPREDVELVLRTHVHWHAAMTETGVDAPAHLPPPDWEQQEWCDQGFSCEHRSCRAAP